jgi:hypothetical protein
MFIMPDAEWMDEPGREMASAMSVKQHPVELTCDIHRF